MALFTHVDGLNCPCIYLHLSGEKITHDTTRSRQCGPRQGCPWCSPAPTMEVPARRARPATTRREAHRPTRRLRHMSFRNAFSPTSSLSVLSSSSQSIKRTASLFGSSWLSSRHSSAILVSKLERLVVPPYIAFFSAFSTFSISTALGMFLS
jgi:hypothetical protein